MEQCYELLNDYRSLLLDVGDTEDAHRIELFLDDLQDYIEN